MMNASAVGRLLRTQNLHMEAAHGRNVVQRSSEAMQITRHEADRRDAL